MFKLSLSLVAGTAALALAATAPAPATAGSVHLTPGLGSIVTESNVIEVQRRRGDRRRYGRWHRRDGWHNRDAWIALGLGSAIIGGMLAAQNSPAYAQADAAWEECARRFRSLQPDGTYTTFDGRQVLCPYLR